LSTIASAKEEASAKVAGADIAGTDAFSENWAPGQGPLQKTD